MGQQLHILRVTFNINIDSISMGKKMVLENLHGQMALGMRAKSVKIKSQVMVNLFGQTKKSMWVTGSITKWRGRGCICGRMEGGTRETSSTIKSMGLE